MPETAPLIFGCAGEALSADEKAFFSEVNPAGFIVFARNCASPDQIRALTNEFREINQDCLILIDQEGGRVQRLRPPDWAERPAARRFGDLFATNPAHAIEACRANARLIARDLNALGINTNCMPVLDVPVAGAHDVVGDRAFSTDPHAVAALGAACCDGLLAGGVLPVIKHIPGHGRAPSDSHDGLPVVDLSLEELRGSDFVPFAALSNMPAAMTAHILYMAIDADLPSSTSPTVVSGLIRGETGFSGLLISDDIGMKALGGSFAARTTGCLVAGCDLVLHCSGQMEEMEAVADAGRQAGLTDAGADRLRAARGALEPPETIDIGALESRVNHILYGV